MNYREILHNAAERARQEAELRAERRPDPRTHAANCRHLYAYTDRLLQHLRGKRFPDPRA